MSLLIFKPEWVTYSVCDPREINQENNRRIENSHLSYNLIRSYKFTKLWYYSKESFTKGHDQTLPCYSGHFTPLQCLNVPCDIQASSYGVFLIYSYELVSVILSTSSPLCMQVCVCVLSCPKQFCGVLRVEAALLL